MPETREPGAPVFLDPLRHEHEGWDGLLEGHRDAGVFHTPGWARVLSETYGHRPFYIGRGGGVQFAQFLPVMEIASRWTGRRGVSLPFSDVCPALAADVLAKQRLMGSAVECGRARGWRYFEYRGGCNDWQGATASVRYFAHALDLTVGTEGLFKGLHSSVRRGIRKAEATGLRVGFDSSLGAMRVYYGLHCRTRRRHGLPPQPWRFFEKIAQYILGQGQGFVAVASLGSRPVAAAVFLHFNGNGVYKFGASDVAFQRLRPNNLLMWEGIKHCAELGLRTLHLGRTSVFQEGLRRFKLGFGAREESLEYCRYGYAAGAFVESKDRAEGWANRVFRLMPVPMLRMAGRILYPHLS